MTDDATTTTEPTSSAPAPPDGPMPPETADDTGSSGAGKRRRINRTIIEWGILLVAAIVLALIIKTFLFQAFYIPSESMVPTLKIGDRVLVNKLSYDLHDVHRGDIVVFEADPNPGWRDTGITDLVKRVIALPGRRSRNAVRRPTSRARCASTAASSKRDTSRRERPRRSRSRTGPAARPTARSTVAPCCPATTS